MEDVTSNEEISINRISSNPVLLSDTESAQSYDAINSGKGKHKGACCRYCSLLWAREKAQNMKSHLALKCKGKVPKEI
ncbi:15243_t:CDS:2 [Gigaspora margarita]|uniref:15243_t:CDS:1 n=1 Tax=Gigaspora margarita TaxID=4874 RepID=A0ABN7VXH7_GIGMA|nr:15243_t:CDS:2 [Gigaspora margarita]